MTLVITGASGNLGHRTAELLLETDGVDPADVVLLTRSPDKLADLAARGAQVRAADFSDAGTPSSAFAGATRVLLVSTDALGDARIAQHQAAIDAAKAAGAQLIAYTSIPTPDRGGDHRQRCPPRVPAQRAVQRVPDSRGPERAGRRRLHLQHRRRGKRLRQPGGLRGRRGRRPGRR
jgi:hypothetical protein